MKKKDPDKAGIMTGTTKIEPMGTAPLPEHTSTSKSQKPKAGKMEKVSRGQRLKG